MMLVFLAFTYTLIPGARYCFATPQVTAGIISSEIVKPKREAISRREPTKPRSKWPHEIVAENFKVHSDFRLAAQDALLLELRQVQADLKAVLGVRDYGQKIHVVLFGSDSEYRRYMQAYFPGLPSRRAIFLQDRGPGMLFTHWHQDVATDLRHEVTHALLNQTGKTLPLWLDEGIAEYFELAASDRFDANPYLESLRRTGQTRVQSIAELDAKRVVSEFTDRDYRDSWAWVHFFIHRRAETREALGSFLRLYASLPESDSAFELERAMRTISPDLESEMREHFRKLHSRPRMVTAVAR
ncbi:MAG: hypothetical protein ACE361_05385 [Aureliella sp.]